MHRVKFKSKRQLDARHAADRAVLVHRAQRAKKVMGGGNVIQPPTPEEIEQFAVGGCGPSCSPVTCTLTPTPVTCTPAPSVCRPTSINDCYHEVATKYGCPMKVTSGGQLNVDGQSRISFIVEPTQSNFFLPIAVRLSARSRDDPDQLLVWRLTAVMVKNIPQENYHEPNPSALTLAGVESVAYDGKTSGDVPGYETAWGPVSRRAQADHLVLVGWNPYPMGTFMNPRAEIWGYQLSTLPVGWECGKHPGFVTTASPSGNPMPPPSSVPTG